LHEEIFSSWGRSCQEVFIHEEIPLFIEGMSAPEHQETGRRIRAALAYGRVPRKDAAAAMHVQESHLDRYTSRTDERYTPGWEDLWNLADLCGLPREFFSADFDRLSEIVPADAPRFDLSREERDAARARTAARLRERAQPPAEHPEADPDTTAARRRRRGAGT